MTKRDMVRGLDAGHCARALRSRFAPPEWAFFEQVANGTGFSQKRWADALAVGIWPSRGFSIHGFEIKVSRSDWKSELANPAKSEAVQQYCDHWWICAPRGMIERDELPPTWGLLEVDDKSRPHTLMLAPKLVAKPLDRQFMAAILRRHSEVYEALLKRDTDAAREETAQLGDPKLAGKLETALRNHETLRAKVEQFEKASGVSIEYGWELGEVGKVVSMLRNHDTRTSFLDRLRGDANSHELHVKKLRQDIEAIEGIGKSEAAQ